jgi:hypothetical protein
MIVAMVRFVILAFVLAACGNDGTACMRNGHTYAIGEVYPAGDNCNNCTCTASGEACTKRACTDAGVDAPLCGASGGCPSGPVCGAVCCGAGEKCVDGACHCATGAACPTGDTCQPPGPLSTDQCGSICCGATGPCPQ